MASCFGEYGLRRLFFRCKVDVSELTQCSGHERRKDKGSRPEWPLESAKVTIQRAKEKIFECSSTGLHIMNNILEAEPENSYLEGDFGKK